MIRSLLPAFLLVSTTIFAAETSSPATAPATQPALDLFGDPLPRGAIGRLGTQRLRTGGSFVAAAFTEDGKKLLTAQDQLPVFRLWDSQDGKPLELPKFDWTTTTTLAPGGTAIATGGKVLTVAHERVQAWDISSGALLFERELEPRSVRNAYAFPSAEDPEQRRAGTSPLLDHVAVSPDGKKVAVSAADVWFGDLAGSAPLKRIGIHAPVTTHLAFSADSSALLSSGEDGAVRIYSALDGKAIATICVDMPGRFSVSISPDARKLAVAYNGSVRFYDIASGKPAEKDHLPVQAVTDAAVQYSPKAAPSGGAALAVWNSKGIQLWDVDGGQVFQTLTPTSAAPATYRARMIFSPGGAKLAALTNGPVCDLFDVATGRRAVEAPAQAGEVSAVAVSPDGQTIAVGTTTGLALWDAATIRPRALPPAAPPPPAPFNDTMVADDPFRRNPFISRRNATSRVDRAGLSFDLTFSPDGKTLFERQIAGLVAWDATTLAGRFGFPAYFEPRHPTAISQDFNYAAVTNSDRNVVIWDLRTGARPRIFNTHSADLTEAERRMAFFTGKGPRSIVFGPNLLLAVTDGREITLWDLTSPEKTPSLTIKPPRIVYSLLFTRDGDHLLAAGDSQITIWNIKNAKSVGQIPVMRGEMAISPDGRLLATTGLVVNAKTNRVDRNAPTPLCVWDLATLTSIAQMPLPMATPTAIAFFPDSRRLVSGSNDGAGALVWDIPLAVGPDAELDAIQFPRLRLDEMWRRLDSNDTAVAYRTVAALTQQPQDAIALLRERLVDAPGDRRPARAATVLAWIGTPESRKLLAEFVAHPKAPADLKAVMRTALRRFAKPPANPDETTFVGFAPERGVGSKPSTRPVTADAPIALSEGSLAQARTSLKSAVPFVEQGDWRIVPIAREWLREEAKSGMASTCSSRLAATAIVLGSFADADSLPELIKQASRKDIDPAARQRLIFAVALVGGAGAKEFLAPQLIEPVLAEDVRQTIYGALADLGDEKARRALLDALRHEIEARREPGHPHNAAVFYAIRDHVADEKAAEEIRTMALSAADPLLQRELTALATDVAANAAPAEELRRRAKEDDVARAAQRYSAIGALGRRGDLSTMAFLEELKLWSAPEPVRRESPSANNLTLEFTRRTAAATLRRRHWVQLQASGASPAPATRPTEGPATRPEE